jgi:DeoR/GlpR family transcriptional regulator of sugar metabolism
MNERQKAILRILGEDGRLSVSELATRFEVSGVTIRQDLDYLQGQGLLRRIHGGAVLNSEEDILRRMGINYETKLAIAQKAASYVESGDTIFIEAGSSNAILARELGRRTGIRIVTNNVFIARTLKDSELDVVLLGGVYQHDSECVVGRLAKLGLETLNFTKTFIGVDGFTEEYGFTCADMMRAEIAGVAIAKSPEVFVLTDSPKFGRIALVQMCEARQATHVITDNAIPAEYRRVLEDAGVAVETV